MRSPQFPRAAFYLLFIASGFAGLIYESVWTHYLKLYLGHAAYAQSLVLMVFMGGMALGATLCARISTRIARPLLAYAVIEAAVGLCALVFHELFVALTDWSFASLLPVIGNEQAALAAKLALSTALILPQSVLLGATFPLMSAGLVRHSAEEASARRGEPIAMLYFANSLGAAAGVLASGFALIAWAGLPGTLRTAGIINLALALAVLLLARGARAAPLAPRPDADADEGPPARLLLGVAFLTGLASFIYEICWIRMLSLVLGASTHSFELMLSTFILGLALGGLAVRRAVDSSASPERLLGWVQVAMGLAALATLPVYDLSFGLMEYLMKGLARSETGYFFFNLSGQAICAVVMLPATFCAGMTLPLITAALLRRGAGERAIGQVYAANTVGAIAGVLLAVHVGLPLLGLKGSLIFGALLDAALGLALLWFYAPRRWPFTAAAAACVLAFLPLSLAFELDANKMTAGVFRYGDLSNTAGAQVLLTRDGKTATVHLVRYSDATSIRTNGKSDGSINMDLAGPRGSDEVTMVLTGALPLALKPEAKSAAVIGIGTGLTTHTLLQSLTLGSVETVEIEAAMAEAARGFIPRNSSAFADPRGRIVIDDAKTFFSTGNRRYDILISEPSNPWVSGVASLFTREFYTRIRSHLQPGGLLVQWFQLYEIDASLLASVMTALGEAFPHYAVFAPSDHDVLIIASERPIPVPVQAAAVAQPGLSGELAAIQVLAPGDLDARYLGSRATLEPLFESYGMPANSDYYPVLDLNAARYRFMERSAADVVGMLTAWVPVLEILEPSPARRPVNPQHRGAALFERVEQTRLARYSRDFLLSASEPEPEAVSTQLQKDLEVVKLRLLECRNPRDQDVWLHSLLNVARHLNPYLPASEASVVWARVTAASCFAGLHAFQRRWIELFAAVGARGRRGRRHSRRSAGDAAGTEPRRARVSRHRRHDRQHHRREEGAGTGAVEITGRAAARTGQAAAAPAALPCRDNARRLRRGVSRLRPLNGSRRSGGKADRGQHVAHEGSAVSPAQRAGSDLLLQQQQGKTVHQGPGRDGSVARPFRRRRALGERARQAIEHFRGNLAQRHVLGDRHAAEHEPEALWILEREGHIGLAHRPQAAAGGGRLLGRAELREAFCRQRRKQRFPIRKMTAGGGVRHPGPARQSPDRKSRNPFFLKKFPSYLKERGGQVSVVISGFPAL
jgi:spermidine synthase